MNYIHQDLAVGKWKQLNFVTQMANIGSEVERTISWRSKGNKPYSQRSFYRALDLLDLTIGNLNSFPKLRELTRLRETLVDYFAAQNNYSSTDDSWRRYFYVFNFSARRTK